jgi:hypothetical protein
MPARQLDLGPRTMSPVPRAAATLGTKSSSMRSAWLRKPMSFRLRMSSTIMGLDSMNFRMTDLMCSPTTRCRSCAATPFQGDRMPPTQALFSCSRSSLPSGAIFFLSQGREKSPTFD